MSINDSESRERLIECAKKEFLEKGFAKASLRQIAAEAGLTTGAVYFFFKDKNGLFGAVVEKTLTRITKVISEHFQEDIETELANYVHTENDHADFADDIVDALYADYDSTMILLKKAQGSEYENVIENITQMLNVTYTAIAEKDAQIMPEKKINWYILHWMCHVQINAFVHLLEHERDHGKAKKKIRPVMELLITSWIDYVLTDDYED